MANIVYVKETTEIKKIEIPDFSANIENIKKEQLKVKESDTLCKMVAIGTNASILDQIGIYLYEMYKPMLCNPSYATHDLANQWVGYHTFQNGIRLEVKSFSTPLVIHLYDFQNGGFDISITKDGFDTYQDDNVECSLESISNLIDLWKFIKETATNTLARYLNNALHTEKVKNAVNIERMEKFNNFTI